MQLRTIEQDGLILAADLARIGFGPREVTRAIQRGQLMRLRRGAFVRPEQWLASSQRDQHLLRIRAVTSMARTRPVLARASAAAVWGMPLDEFPAEVTFLDRWRGGGRSEPGVVRTARGATTAEIVVRGGFACTTLPRTLLDLCRGGAFRSVVPLMDWSLWRGNPLAVTKEQLAAEASVMGATPALWRAIDFSTSQSGSIGESEARVVIDELGYPRPVLQHRFSDPEGDIYPDFYFEDADAAVEFDGKTKYTRNEYTKGDPVEVLWREKKREDRLRRQVRTVVRVLTHDVRTPRLLDQKLADAGIRRVSPWDR